MPVSMTNEKWHATCQYLDDVFGAQDERLATLMPRAVAAGVPDIAVSPSVGRLLTILARLVAARTIIEVGTLAGYSGIWLARGLSEGGRLITIEPEPVHADFAAAEFIAAGVADRAQIRRGHGLGVLPALVGELGAGSVDLVFLDAIKTEYPVYLPYATELLRPGGLLVADNALGSGSWWIDGAPGSGPERDAVDRFNRTVAADDSYEAACVPIREGVLIARKRG
jgi:caffeoyl-CoA O-methyltransferase